MIKFTKKAQRITGQIRYRPTLSSWENTLSASKKAEKQYTEWKLNQESDIILFSPKEKKFLRAKYESVTCVDENDGDVSELVKRISETYNGIIKDAEIKKIRHVGFRNTIIFESDFKYSELVELINEKFNSQNKDLVSIVSDVVKDVTFIQDSEKNGFMNHITLGPTSKEEAIKNFNPQFAIDEEKWSAESYLFLDVDVFLKENIKTENALEEFEKIINENLRISKELIDYILS